MALERLAAASSAALAVVLVVVLVGDLPPYLRIVLVLAAALAALGAREVRRGDLLGWSLPVGAALATASGVAVVHSWGLPGVRAGGWSTAALAAVALAASVLVAALARQVATWSRRRSTSVHAA